VAGAGGAGAQAPLVILSWLAVLVIAGRLLGHLTRAILLVVLSGVIAFAVTPLANLHSRWLPRPVALGLAYLFGGAVIVGFGVLVVATAVSQVVSLVAAVPDYARQAQALLPQAEAVLGRLGVPPETLPALKLMPGPVVSLDPRAPEMRAVIAA
jgi:predicted PurR-regulated permease PerM